MNSFFDCIVVGGGPAGLIAAGQAGARGARVLLLEKNKELGKKIKITGHGRCNIVQAEFNLKTLVSSYGENGKFLFSCFNNFGPKKIMEFFEDIGVALKTEANGRVFPSSDNAEEVVTVLIKYLRQNKVEIKYGVEVKDIVKNKSKIVVTLNNGDEIETKNIIIATGGLSYPVTGSTGDGFVLAEKIGHPVTKTIPALVPLKTKESWVKKIQGLSLSDIKVTLYKGKKKIKEANGDILFTHFGITGPVILNISKFVLNNLGGEEVFLKINFFPTLTQEQLEKKLIQDFHGFGKKLIKNVLGSIVQPKAVLLLLELAKINADKPANSINKEERKRLLEVLNSLKLTILGSLGYEIAMATSGGIDLKEIDPKTMQSKIHSGIYFAGEVLDIDGPTGGYNLTAAWSTGYSAGNNITLG
ncbi:MAG: HI0933 family protein [Candidatus Magasanikbacteria bacterium GW2011_GWA2_37_8]|uniref:HI0933 family protein n=1 Tax=Candidatus Magasanikbacteria bacterium GW2011_GWA2_37_8 TaxID=1619036 RepID=A0A0G0KH63_9BACT|nr:MAG: HI0933 family protein [Candidatus Magasanikbacteria bacterium GW2011_GWA2_37_8]